MKSVLYISWKLPQLILAMTGLSWLLASCANTNQKTTNVSSPFPITYNTGARGFEGNWPYGPAGYR